jgi:hypothetical protein
MKRVSQTLKKDNAYNKALRSLSFSNQFTLNIPQQTNKILRYRSNLSLWESKVLFSYIPAQFFSDFIALQIKLSPKHRNEAFSFGIQAGISSMLSFYFNSRSKNFVSGIKVICKGK